MGLSMFHKILNAIDGVLHKVLDIKNCIVIEREDNYACDQCHKLIEDNWNDCNDCPDAVSCFDCGKAGDVCVSCLEEFYSEEWPF